MQSRNTIVTTVIILLLLSVLLSGCTGEKNIAPAPDSIRNEAVDVSSQNLTQSSKEENIPEIKITSFSSIYMHDNSDNEDIYLFSWENVPGNESHRLLSFLKNDLQIDWVENAQITKAGKENKTIRVFTDENSIEIMLYNESVLLKIGDGGHHYTYDLWVKEENGTHDVYNKKHGTKYDISERYYAAYGLSIKNNGSNTIDFKLNGLHLYESSRIFNTTSLPPYDKNSSLLEVLQDLEKENKLQDTTLLPGQSLNGIVAFRVNSLYNKSFLLKYDTMTVTSASFEKSIEALAAAEYFNYSVALGIPPYNLYHLNNSYEPIFDNYNTWANWVNRSIFETFQKSDLERTRKSPPENIPLMEMVYALRVFPEKNITMFPVTRQEFSTSLLVMDDTGEEMINTSRITGVAVLRDQAYTLFEPRWKLIMPQMNFSNAYVVRISFSGYSYASGRLSINNQDIILDDKLNIIVVRNYPVHFNVD
ncbi:MAG: hypothetical protein OIN66_04880 [Candidatus Methanoperedens sp.]|nr:hypothetical protein [Candidatus Methanoperedens sp.]